MKFLVITIISFLLSACSFLSPQKTMQINTYTLVPKLNIHAARHSYRTLLVSAPIPVPGLNTDQMAYTEKPYQIKYFAENKWIGTPAQMLMPILVTALQQTHHYRAVVSPPFAGVTRDRVDTQILKFQREFSVNKQSQVVIVIREQIIRTSNNNIVAAKTFMVKQTVNGINPYDGVIAFNQATAKIMRQITSFTVKNT